MSCRKRCKREILKFAGYIFRFITGTLNTGKVGRSSLTDRSLHHIPILIRVLTFMQIAPNVTVKGSFTSLYIYIV